MQSPRHHGRGSAFPLWHWSKMGNWKSITAVKCIKEVEYPVVSGYSQGKLLPALWRHSSSQFSTLDRWSKKPPSKPAWRVWRCTGWWSSRRPCCWTPPGRWCESWWIGPDTLTWWRNGSEIRARRSKETRDARTPAETGWSPNIYTKIFLDIKIFLRKWENWEKLVHKTSNILKCFFSICFEPFKAHRIDSLVPVFKEKIDKTAKIFYGTQYKAYWSEP